MSGNLKSYQQISCSYFSGSQQAGILPQPQAAACMRARVRARAHTRTVVLLTKRSSLHHSLFDSTCSRIKQLPLQVVPPDSLLICPAVTNDRPPLRGGRSFALQDRIVTLQKLYQSYQIDTAGNWSRGDQQEASKLASTILKSLILILNLKLKSILKS